MQTQKIITFMTVKLCFACPPYFVEAIISTTRCENVPVSNKCYILDHGIKIIPVKLCRINQRDDVSKLKIQHTQCSPFRDI